MLQAEGLQCIRGERTLFTGLGFGAGPGTLLRIEGPNGSGKTSLLRMLCGLSAPHAGEIRWHGAAIRQEAENYRAALFYVGHQNALKDDLNGVENLQYAAALRGRFLAKDIAREALDSLGLGSAANRPVRTLSQGQKRRVALAALKANIAAPLWLLDEPFVGLDAVAIATVSQCIEAHVADGGITLYTTHQDVPMVAPLHAALRLT